MLWSRRDRRSDTRPLCISHGAGWPGDDGERYLREFDWTGTRDPGAWLVVPDCIDLLGSLRSGGWAAHIQENRALALRARELLCEALEIDVPAPESMVGALAAVPIGPGPELESPGWSTDPLQELLAERWSTEVIVSRWPLEPERVLRVSAQAYNSEDEMRFLADILKRILSEGHRDRG